MTILRLILSDQLNMNISALEDACKEKDVILMCEVLAEATRIKHHKKKLVLWFSAMRHFARDLKEAGYNVEYVQLEDYQNSQSLLSELKRAAKKHSAVKIITTEASEYALWHQANSWGAQLGMEVEIKADNRFLATKQEFSAWAGGCKELRMEFFYRLMRQKYNILMDDNKPVGGKWNYDAENRKSLKDATKIPATFIKEPDAITQEVIAMVERHFSDHYGEIKGFIFAVTRAEALSALELFIRQRLNKFGDYQDSMIEGEPWLYHSHLSFYLNCGLLCQPNV